MSRSNTLRLLVAAALTTACALPVAADADHWPGYGGGPTLSGLQPVDPAIPPVRTLFTVPDEKVLTSPVITTTTGSDGYARVAYATEGGTVIVRALDDEGTPVSLSGGVTIDDGADDTDTFTGEGAIGVLKAQGVGLVDSSTDGGLGNVFALHNDDDQTGSDDIAIAVISEETGTKPDTDLAVPGTDGFTVSSSPILTEQNDNGARTLFFTAFRPCDLIPVVEECDPTGEPDKTVLFKVPIENAQFPEASFDPATVTSVEVPSGNQLATPTLVTLLQTGNNPADFVVVPGTAGVVRSYKALDLAAGPVSPDLGDAVQSVSVKVSSDGLPAPFSDALFVAAGQASNADTKVYRLTHAPDSPTFSIAGQSNVIGGTPAAALAIAEEADGGPGRVVVTTGKQLAALDTGDLTVADRLSDADNLVPGTTGFSKTTAAVYGGFAYLQRDGGEHLVLDIPTAETVPASDFTQDAANAEAKVGNGQPALSHGLALLISDKGLFAYDVIGAAGANASLLTASAAPVTEGNPLHFTIKLSRKVPRTVRFKYATADATAIAGSDYTATGGTFELAPNQLTGEIDVATTGDPLDEADETVHLVLSEAEHAVISEGGTFTGVIGDDDTAQASAIDATAKEGDEGKTAVAVPIRLTGPASAPVRVGYATADDEAQGGVDYDPVVGEVTFEPGQTEKLVSVNVRGDEGKESAEHFRLELVSADGAGISRQSGIVTITDDDGTAVDRRRKPGGLVMEISPLRDVSAPFIFTARGRLLKPRKMSKKKACSGKVLLELMLGDKRVARRLAPLSKKTCRFAARLRLARLPKGTKASVLRVQATFQGNKNLQPVKAPSLLARLS